MFFLNFQHPFTPEIEFLIFNIFSSYFLDHCFSFKTFKSKKVCFNTPSPLFTIWSLKSVKMIIDYGSQYKMIRNPNL